MRLTGQRVGILGIFRSAHDPEGPGIGIALEAEDLSIEIEFALQRSADIRRLAETVLLTLEGHVGVRDPAKTPGIIWSSSEST